MTSENYKLFLEGRKKLGFKEAKPQFDKDRADVWEEVYNPQPIKSKSKKDE